MILCGQSFVPFREFRGEFAAVVKVPRDIDVAVRVEVFLDRLRQQFLVDHAGSMA